MFRASLQELESALLFYYFGRVASKIPSGTHCLHEPGTLHTPAEFPDGRQRCLASAFAYLSVYSHGHELYHTTDTSRNREESLTFQVIRQVRNGDDLLGICRDLPHEYRSFDRFFVTHDEDVRWSKIARRYHLFADTLEA